MKDKVLAVVTVVATITSLVCFALYFKFNGNSLNDYKKSEDFYKSLDTECTEKRGDEITPPSVNFTKLKKINDDLVYYLTIDDTTIKYPVVQGKDNDFYLKHMFNKKENLGGSIFLDYRCQKDPTQGYSIIYGHRMKDDSMFGKLDEFLERSYLEKHRGAWLLAPETAYRVRLDSCLLTNDRNIVYALEGQQAGRLVLSTCAYEGDNNRIVLIGTVTGKYSY